MQNAAKLTPDRGRVTVKQVLINLLPFLFSITCIIPLVWLFYSTLKTNTQFESNAIALPTSINWDNYGFVFGTTNMWRYLWNTFRNTLLAMVGILYFGFVNGYILTRFRFKARNLLFGCYISALFIPIHALLVPTYLMFSTLNMADKWYTTVFPLIATQLTTTIFLVSSYVKTVPVELEEAAAIDGSGFSHTMFTIILPIVKPALVTAGIIAFFHCWNEFSYSLILLNDEKLYTVSLSLTRFKGENRIDYPKMMTAMVIAMLPALTLYVLFSKHIIKGLVAGAIKG